jgi:Na+-driven multidrug efflux pump
VNRIRRGTRAGAIAGVITAAIIAGFMFLFGRPIISLFIDAGESNAVEAIRIAIEYLWLMSAFLPVLYILHVYRSTLQGMGDTMSPMVSGIAEFVMRTGAALLLPGLIGYWGVFWAEALAWVGADLILVPAYWVGFNKIKRLYGEEK